MNNLNTSSGTKILLDILPDTSVLDQIINPFLFKNLYFRNTNIFIPENYLTYDINKGLNYRPDIVSYKVYGNDLYYPIILYCNNIRSILEFNVDQLGTTITYLNPGMLSKLR